MPARPSRRRPSTCCRTLDTTVVATFDADELLDYRARRPIILFEGDHLADYRPPRLSLDLARDEIGQQFLMLTGYEPDFQWERFSSARARTHRRPRGVVDHVDQLHPDARAAHAPDRHDRERQSQPTSSRPCRSGVRTTQVPSNALHLVEYRLQEAGASDDRLRAPDPALPVRCRVPDRRGRRARGDQRFHRADLPDRRAARAGPGVRRPHRRAGRRERRAREARRHARGAPRLLHGGHDPPVAAHR